MNKPVRLKKEQTNKIKEFFERKMRNILQTRKSDPIYCSFSLICFAINAGKIWGENKGTLRYYL
jgi:hypothetical protein